MTSLFINPKNLKERLAQPCDGLSDAQIFSNLTAAEMAPFRYATQTRNYKKGKIIYLEGEGAEYFYIIRSGWLKLFHTLPEGDEVIVDMLTARDMLGESAIFDQGLHTSSAQVVEDCQMLVIPSKVLKEQAQSNSKLSLNLLSSLSQHYRRQHGALAFNSILHAPQRIACFLLRLCPKNKEKDIVFHLPYDKTLIASILGIQGATFSRALNILREKAFVRIRNTRVEIDSVEPLMKFVFGTLAAKYTINEMPIPSLAFEQNPAFLQNATGAYSLPG